VSSRARQLSGGDFLFISIPKSGRTWVRTFVCAYFCEKLELPFRLDPETHGAPRVIYSHDLFEQRTKARRWDKVRGKYLIPKRERDRLPVALLARDPRDAFVSLHIQLTRRTEETPERLKRMSSTELLRDPAFGIESMITVMNCWLAEWGNRSNFLLLRYESLRQDPETGFRGLLHWLGEKPVEEPALRQALTFSDFAHMQKLESAGGFASKILRAGDAHDPESFKVRRGKIGGFADYLSADDQTFAAAVMQNLDPRFDYSTGRRYASK
jgi:hypothetical protein